MADLMGKNTPLLVPKVWGGKRLAQLKGSDEKIGESWEVASLPEGQSTWLGKALNEKDLSYVIKFLETTAPLSIQVHPNDHWAQELEQSQGKDEFWIILEAESQAGVYLGLKEGVSAEVFSQKVLASEDVSQLMNFIPAKKGQIFTIPAGMIHALGPGLVLLEVQKASGITYRLWDWNRVDDKGSPRPLHLEKGLKVSDFSLKSDMRMMTGREDSLIHHANFKVDYNEHERKVEAASSLTTIVCLEGKLEVSGKEKSFSLNTWETALVKTDVLVSPQGLGHWLSIS